MDGVVDGQMKRHHAVATVGRTTRYGVCRGMVALRVGVAVYPPETPAGGLHIRTGRVAVNRQVQRVHLRTAVGVRMLIRIVTALRICRAVPGIRFASSLSHGSVHGVVDSQM